MEDYGKVADVKKLLVTEKTSDHRKDLILMYLNWVSIKDGAYYIVSAHTFCVSGKAWFMHLLWFMV